MRSWTGRIISIRRTIFPERGLRVTAGFRLLLAAALFAGDRAPTAAVLLAAAMHEAGHLLALRCFRVPVEGLRLTAFGAVLYARGAGRLSYGRELLVTLAGPAVNFICAPLAAAAAARFGWEWGWLFAGAHALLGVFNLLPVPPLDGGRALYLAAAYFFGPAAGDAVTLAAGLACSLALCALGAYLTLARGRGAFFLLASLGLLSGALRQFLRASAPSARGRSRKRVS